MQVLTHLNCFKDFCELTPEDKLVTSNFCLIDWGDIDCLGVSVIARSSEIICSMPLCELLASCCEVVPACYVSTEFSSKTFSFDVGGGVATSDKTGYLIGTSADGDTIRADLEIVGGHKLVTVDDIAPNEWPSPWAESPMSLNTSYRTSVITWSFDRQINGAMSMSLFDIDTSDDISGWSAPPDSIGPTGDLVETVATWNNFSGNQISFTWENRQNASSNYAFNGDLDFSVQSREEGTQCVNQDGSIKWAKDKYGADLDPSRIVDC